VNCLGLNHILEAARLFHIRRVVWASSAGALGSPQMYDQEWIPDDVLLHPRSVYGACKALNEFLAHHYFDQMGVDNIGLRFPIVYGRGRLRGAGAFASELLEHAAIGKSFTIPYGSETLINWQYVEDAARCIFLACLAGRTETRVFNTSGDLRTVGEVIQCIKRMLPETDLSCGKETIGFAQRYDKENIKRQLGYEPQYPIEKGFKKTIDEFRAKAGLLKIS
jgi:nucleoside-diphosphate-sugar epimerase